MKIVFILLLFLTFYYFQGTIYLKKSFEKLLFQMKFSVIGIFEGEEAELIQTVTNNKLLPLWWISAQFGVSRNLDFSEKSICGRVNDNYIKNYFTLFPYEKLTKKYPIIGTKRGYYKIEELDLMTVDLFAKFKMIKTQSVDASIYVYPELIKKQELNICYEKMNGDILVNRNIMEDSFQLRGIRDYDPFDSLKTVNWKATARTGEIKVNQYDYTASQEVMIFINVTRYNAWDPDFFIEESIRLAASLALLYIKDGMSVGIVSNANNILSGKKIYIKPQDNINSNISILQELALMDTTNVKVGIENILNEETLNMTKASVWILISHYAGYEVQCQVDSAKEHGQKLLWVLPKATTDKIEVKNKQDLFIWEVKEL